MLDMSNSTYRNVTLLTASKKAEQKLFLCSLFFFLFLSAYEDHSEVPTTYYHQIFIRVTVGRWQAYMAAIIHQNICNLIKFHQ